MNKLQQLIEAANKAQDIQDAYPGHDYRVSVNATTILELCALLEKVEEALETITQHSVCCDARHTAAPALAAIKQWKEQT